MHCRALRHHLAGLRQDQRGAVAVEYVIVSAMLIVAAVAVAGSVLAYDTAAQKRSEILQSNLP